jgi:hypothetical protein
MGRGLLSTSASSATAPWLPGQEARGPVLCGETGERPHDIHEIFGFADGAAPHILIAMRQLRRRAGMDGDGLVVLSWKWSHHGDSTASTMRRIPACWTGSRTSGERISRRPKRLVVAP